MLLTSVGLLTQFYSTSLSGCCREAIGRGTGGLGSLPVLTLSDVGAYITPGCASGGEKDNQGAPHMFGYVSGDGESCKCHGADNRCCGGKAEMGKEGVLNQYILNKYSLFCLKISGRSHSQGNKKKRDLNK